MMVISRTENFFLYRTETNKTRMATTASKSHIAVVDMNNYLPKCRRSAANARAGRLRPAGAES